MLRGFLRSARARTWFETARARTWFGISSRACAVIACSCLSAALLGCPGEGGTGEEDGGAPPPDLCNSKEEAFGADCTLALGGEPRLAYIGESGDQDWYGIQLPSTLTPRSLLHVTGGYAVPNTAVNLGFNILRADGTMSVAQASDRHLQAAPKPVDIIVPFSESGAKLVVQVADDPVNPTRPLFDALAAYSIRAEVVENPDTNEPNDTTPTSLTLMPVSGVPSAQTTGFLATTDDVDQFAFTAPANKILYLHITAPKVSPPPPFRLSYTLYDAAKKPVAEGRMETEALAVDLATARSLAAGAYTLTLQAYRPLGQTGPIPGDLRQMYTVELKFFDELDANEPNDTLAAARPLTLGTPKTGKLAYVPDLDWFYVDLPASTPPTVLRYKLTAATAAGRFTQLPGPTDRNVRVFTQVNTGATQADKVLACKTDATVCPKGYDGRSFLVANVDTACTVNTPPLCIQSERVESVNFPALRNFEGRLPVPSHGAAVRYFFLVQDSGNNWADDRDYTLDVSLLPDPDEDGRPATTPLTLAEDVAAASFPVPTGGTSLTGDLSHGYGRLIRNNPNNGQGVRGVDDYDAVPTDIDRYELSFPAITPADKTWMVQWTVGNQPDGGAAADLSLELEFCDGRDGGTGTCSSVTKGSKGGPLVLAYQPDAIATWYSPDTAVRQVIYDRMSSGGTTTVTARANACYCFEPRFVQGGKFYVKVGAVDRWTSAPVTYTVRTAFTDYPKGYGTDAGTKSCPGPSDAGTNACNFTREP